MHLHYNCGLFLFVDCNRLLDWANLKFVKGIRDEGTADMAIAQLEIKTDRLDSWIECC